MAKEVRRERRPRGSIDPDMILDGAFEVAERVGLDKLSMPDLAAHLNVGVTSIYWHYRNKEALLRRMSGRAISEIQAGMPPVEGRDPSDWREFLLEYFRHFYRSHRTNDLYTDITLMRSSTFSTKSTHLLFSGVEAKIEYLIRAGFIPRDAYYFYSVCSSYSRGIVMTERNQRVNQTPPSEGLGQIGLLQPETMPILSQLILEEGVSIDMVGEQQFEYGMNFLLDAGERLLASNLAAKAAEQV